MDPVFSLLWLPACCSSPPAEDSSVAGNGCLVGGYGSELGWQLGCGPVGRAWQNAGASLRALASPPATGCLCTLQTHS